MTNTELHGYRAAPICDSHIHTHTEIPVAQTLTYYRDVMRYFHYERIALQALPSYTVTDNFIALYSKANIEGVYAGVGLHHFGDSRDTAQGYYEQIKALYEMGADGVKMLEGKPGYHRTLGNRRLDDPVYDRFYEFIQEKELPLLMHLGDPAVFWDPVHAPDWVKARGWVYDESYQTLAGLRDEVEGVLEKFPNLRLTLAHFYFMSEDWDFAEDFMARHPRVQVDLTPGTEMFRGFTANYDRARRFFYTYADRILYGTDIYNRAPCTDEEMEKKYGHAVRMVRSFLEKKEEFVSDWIGGEPLRPFGFDNAMLDRLYRDNFLSTYGDTPRPLDDERIAHGCRVCLQSESLNPLERENMQTILDYFAN